MSCPLYQELPLDSTKRQIRILQFYPALSPGKPDIVQCQMIRISLEDEPPCEYHAVSYTWGDPTRKIEICINGHVLLVPYNTYDALQHLCRHGMNSQQSPLRVVNIWIDAVCIDQGNVAERGQQVAFMDQVFSKSAEVLVWLGDDDGLGPETYDLVERICAHCDAVAKRVSDDVPGVLEIRVAGSAEDPKYMHDFLLSPAAERRWGVHNMQLSSHENELLKELYGLPWFRRVWILQEVTLAKWATCYYGTHHLGLEKILIACKWLPSHHPDYFSIPFESARHIYYTGNTTCSLTNYLALCRDRETSDPRDHVFALLGLLDQAKRAKYSTGHGGIEPDYTKSILAVRRNAIRYCIWEDQDLSIFKNMKGGVLPDDDVPDSPSWAFRNTVFYSEAWSESAPNSIVEHALQLRFLEDPNVLSIGGVFIASIDRVTFTLPARVEDESALIELTHGIDSVLEHERERLAPVQEQDVVECVCRALACNFHGFVDDARHEGETALSVFLSAWEKRNLCRMSSTFASGTHGEGDDSTYVDSETIWRLLYTIDVLSSGRSLFVTTDGSIGQGPNGTRAGDIVVRLSGAQAPTILRRKGEFWQFLGNCYLHGLAEEAAEDAVWEWFNMV